jgi:hypothetical protein
MSDSAGTIGYAAAADAYWQAGWRGVLPMCRGFKGGRQAMLPVGYTGHQGVDPSYADILEWSANPVYADGNLCLRMPDGVVGIDVDAYGAKTGGRALTEAISRWGPLPAGPRSTSRRDTDPVSGIRLFRIPPSTLLQDRIAFTELGVGDIELCQRHHRYVVCWPSIHPEGRAYWWTNEDMQLIGIPAIDELPWLPQAWIDALRVTPRSLNLNGEHYDVRATLTAGEPSIAVTSRLSQAIKELNLPGQSRHDTCCRHVMALMRMGKNGDPGVHQALGVLREVLVAARRTDNSNTPDGTRDEFDRMITNDNAARELATPSPLDWMKALDTPTNGSTPSGGVEGVDYRDVPAVGADTDASTTEQAAQYIRELHDQQVREQAMKLRIRDEAQAMWNRQRAALMGQQPPVMVSMPDFLAVPDEDTVYRVGELFPIGARVLLTAQYKAGKTSIIANLLRSLVDGDPFLGRYSVESIERVLLIDTELDERTLRRWLRDQTIRNIEGINVLSLRGRLSSFAITDDRNRAEWAARIAGAELIMLDCLRPCLDALGLSEDKDAGIFLTAFDALCRESGAGEAVVVHHMGHSMERSRGDSRLLDWPDALWKLVREQDEDGAPIEMGDRYFSAIGRDVNVGESLLDWQPETRALTVVGGNRIDKKARNAVADIVEIMRNPTYTDGVSKNQLVNLLKNFGHGRNVSRSAVYTAIERNVLYIVEGPNRVQLHRLNPSLGDVS